jgi:hypothetical protein
MSCDPPICEAECVFKKMSNLICNAPTHPPGFGPESQAMSLVASAPTSIRNRPLSQFRTSHSVASALSALRTRGRESIIKRSESRPCPKNLMNATNSNSLVPLYKAPLTETLYYGGADGWARCKRGTNGFEPEVERLPPKSSTARSGTGTASLARAGWHRGNAVRIHGRGIPSGRPRATGGCGAMWPGAGLARHGPGLSGSSGGSRTGS